MDGRLANQVARFCDGTILGFLKARCPQKLAMAEVVVGDSLFEIFVCPCQGYDWQARMVLKVLNLKAGLPSLHKRRFAKKIISKYLK